MALFGMDEIFTVDETVAKLKLNADNIRRLLRNEQIPGIKIGAREWRISAKALQVFIDHGGTPDKPRDIALAPAQRRRIEKKAATDPKWKNKTTGAKKPGKAERP